MAKKPRAPPAPRQNTAVYVSGLPADATASEVAELFSRKAGMIAEDVDTGQPRVKLYVDDAGAFKGDALVVFYKPQSVEMAVMLLDETCLRFEDEARGAPKMRVQVSDPSYKKSNRVAEGGGAGAAAADQTGGAESAVAAATEASPAAAAAAAAAATPDATAAGSTNGQTSTATAPPIHQMNATDRAKLKARRMRMDAKLADWDDDDEAARRAAQQAASRWDKMVILKHMFTLDELAADPAALLDIKEDVRDECAKLGTVSNVVLFDLEPDGVVSVKFSDADAARACVVVMDGRAFGGQTVEAAIATGKERYRKSKHEDEYEGEGDER